MKLRRTLALLVCGALVFAACGGGGSDDPDTEEADSSPSAEATEEPTVEPTSAGTPIVETDFEDGTAGPWATETSTGFAIVPDAGTLGFFIGGGEQFRAIVSSTKIPPTDAVRIEADYTFGLADGEGYGGYLMRCYGPSGVPDEENQYSFLYDPAKGTAQVSRSTPSDFEVLYEGGIAEQVGEDNSARFALECGTTGSAVSGFNLYVDGEPVIQQLDQTGLPNAFERVGVGGEWNEGPAEDKGLSFTVDNIVVSEL